MNTIWRICKLMLWGGLLVFPVGVAAASESFEDILYLGDVPVLLRLELVVDGKPWKETRRSIALRQFELLDSDSDGHLQVEQLEGLPLSDFDASRVESWDTEDADEKLSRNEFLNVIAKFGQPAFLLAEGDSRAASRVKLFPHLDVNQDGKLTGDELKQARKNLAWLDYDDDETISTTELAPFANPLFQQGFIGREQPLAKNAPFVAVGSFSSKADLATSLLKRYGDATDETPVEALRCQLGDLGPSDATRPFDENKDQQLDHTEATRYLESMKPDIVLQVELPVRRASRPKVKLLADEIKASKRRPSRIRGSSRLPLKAGKTSFDVRVLSSLTKTADNRNFFLLEFRRADEDKNTYLDAMEFGRIGLDAPFDRVDIDGDEKVIRDELIAYLERDAFASQSQIVMSVAADSKTLFSEFDRNIDQRLTVREFKEMGNRLQYLDLNGDGTVEANEMAHEYRLMFSMGRPRVFQQAMSSQQNNNTPTPRATPNRQAPEWFRKMDRNQDGDLSWREFLGKKKTFEDLDKDSDGLVSAAELE